MNKHIIKAKGNYPKGFNKLSPHKKYEVIASNYDEYTKSKLGDYSDYFCSKEQIEEYYLNHTTDTVITPLDLGDNGGFDLFR